MHPLGHPPAVVAHALSGAAGRSASRGAIVTLLALAIWATSATTVAAHHSPNAVYAGTHSGGGTMEFAVSPDGALITRSKFLGVPCQDGSGTLDSEVTFSAGGVSIVNHAFIGPDPSHSFSGSFAQVQSASGSFQVASSSLCVTEAVSWSANTTAAPPPPCLDGVDNDGDGKIDLGADPGCSNGTDTDETDPPRCSDGLDNDGDGRPDLTDPGCSNAGDDDEVEPPDRTPPGAALSGKRTQKAGRSIAVRVSCPSEDCTVRATGTVNVPGARASRRFKLGGALAEIPAGGNATLRLRVSRRALGAIRRALRSGAEVRSKVTVSVRDSAGNRTTKRRTLRLRR